MPTTVTPSFLDQLRVSGLLESKQLEELAALPEARQADPRPLASQVLQRGWLTTHQINQVVLGRDKELFIGPYVLLEKLGEGGMGTVFKARQRHLGRVVALKIIRKEKLANPDAVQRFHREARAVAQLSHPNIVLALDAGQDGDTHYLSMEFVDGVDLARLVHKSGPLPVADACEYVRQAALGLEHAHGRGLVHRDIKPHNLLLTHAEGPGKGNGPVVKILDLGLALQGGAAKEATMTQTGAVVGMPAFLAPEQALNSHTADIRADLYSLGCTLYFLLVGRPPFEGESLAQILLQHQMQEAQPLQKLRADVPPGVAAVVKKLMAKRPEDRFQTPTELAQALEASGPGGRTFATTTNAARPPPSRTGAVRMAWPLSQDYNEAVQNPRTSFSDPELREGQPALNPRGLPMPRSGNFADVYEFVCLPTQTRWAVKCFTRSVADLRERYSEISRHLQDARLPFTVDFQFLQQGICIRGQWYPILKMRWVEGVLLNEFVRDNLDKPVHLQKLSQIWLRMVRRLREAGAAHGDLQHGNVLLVAGSKNTSLSVKLIDYDGMFVPALARSSSGEVGHPNYQHPQRIREGTYNLEVDRVPLLVVATALRGLIAGDRGLWERHDNGDNLLFRESDLRDPARSALFRELRQLSDPLLQSLVAHLTRTCQGRLGDAPLLEEVPPEEKPPAPARAPSLPQAVIMTASAAAAPVPDWDFSDTVAPTRPGRKKGGRPVGSWVAAGATTLFLAVVGIFFATRGSGDPSQGLDGEVPPPLTIQPAGQPEKFPNTLKMQMVLIREGTFQMGSLPEDKDKVDTAVYPHRVRITRPFYMAATEVTVGQFKQFVKDEGYRTEAETDGKGGWGYDEDTKKPEQKPIYNWKNPGWKQDDDHPVVNVTWNDAVAFCKWLSKKERKYYDLPTEAEWEYACRAKTTTPYHSGDDPESLVKVGNVADASYKGKVSEAIGQLALKGDDGYVFTAPVRKFKPNDWGLYDMHGNAQEWCKDGPRKSPDKETVEKQKDPIEDPKGELDGNLRVRRGGSWCSTPSCCRSAHRHVGAPDYRDTSIGFRVVLRLGDRPLPIRPVESPDKLKSRIQELKDSDPRVRASAARALGSLGKSAAPAVPALIEALRDREVDVRREAVSALGRIGKAAQLPEVVPALVASLDDTDVVVLQEILKALGEIGRPLDEPAVNRLVELARTSSDTAVRKTALNVIPSSLDELSLASLAKEPQGRNAALVEVLGAALKEGDPSAKVLAAARLANLGENAGPAVKNLAALLDDDTAPAEARRNAALALTKVPKAILALPPSEAQEVVRKLARALEPGKTAERRELPAEAQARDAMREFSAEALARISFPLAEGALEQLVRAIRNDRNPKVRQRAIWVFLNADSFGGLKGAKEALLEVLKKKGEEPLIRYEAARALAQGLAAQAPDEVIDTLEEMLRDKSIPVYRQTNVDVKGGQSKPREDVGGDARCLAAHALTYIGPRAKQRNPKIVGLLKELANSKDPMNQQYARLALEKIGE